MFFTDIGDHWSHTRSGGVQGDRRRTLGRGIVGVPKQPLEHRSDDAGGRPALPHHHCHDPGMQTAAQASWAVPSLTLIFWSLSRRSTGS